MHNFEYLREQFKAYKSKFGFADDEKYIKFIAQQSIKTNPKYINITSIRTVDTEDGPMEMITLSDKLEIPGIYVAAQCTVNGVTMLVFNDAVWMPATMKLSRNCDWRLSKDTDRLIVYKVISL